MHSRKRVLFLPMVAMMALLLLSACGADSVNLEPGSTMLLFSQAGSQSATTLEGRTVSGTVTIHLANEMRIGQVSFFLNAPEDSDRPVHVARTAPFTYELDTTQLANGSHNLTVVALAKRQSNVRVVANSNFAVSNGEAAPGNEAPEPDPAPGGRWQPKPGLTWYWQLSGPIDMNRNVDVYDIDYETSPDVVAALHAKGKKVIAYVPVGDWEDYRPDSGEFPAASLCGSIDGWPERYIDIRNAKAVALIKDRITLAASKGFDGIEGDVVDLHLVQTGCASKITEAQMTAFLRDLTDHAHSLGLAYFAKNVTENAAEWSTFMDGVVAEEGYLYGDAAGYMPYIRAGKPVFAVEYGSDKPTQAQCNDANQRGYSLYGTNLSLTGVVYKTCW